MDTNIHCPFCGEGDFDLLGLKIHLTGPLSFCPGYEKINIDLEMAKEREAIQKIIEGDIIEWEE